MHVGIEILLHLGGTWLNVAWQVEVVAIALYLVPLDQSAVMVDGLLCIPSIYDTLDVLLTQTVLVTVLTEAILGINHENAF